MPRHGFESLDVSLALEAAKPEPVPPGGGGGRAWLRIAAVVVGAAVVVFLAVLFLFL